MESYTITVLPNDGSGNSTTLVVETSGDQVCITDVRLHAPGGLTGGKLPTIDFGLLLKAVAPAAARAVIESGSEPSRAAVAAPPPGPAVVAPPPGPAAAEPPPAAAPGPANDDAQPAPVAVPRARRAKRTPAPAPAAIRNAAATKAAAKTTAAKTTAARKVAVKKAPAPKIAAPKVAVKRAARGSAPARKPATKGGAAAAADSRAYRRMPDDLAAVYRQAGTAAAIADHYDVPRHTVQGWLRRLRSAGS